MNLTKKALIVFGSSLSILILLEILIRTQAWEPVPLAYDGKFSDRVAGGRIECMNPKVSRTYFNRPTNPYPNCIFYSINNMGLRNSYHVMEAKPKESERIIFVGDSFTFGFGVLEEDTFIDKLEKSFRQEGKKIEVLNAAEPGANLIAYRDIVKNNVLKLHPDVMVIGINLNDIIDFPTSIIVEKISRKFTWKLRDSSKLINFICYVIEKNISAKENIAFMLSTYTPRRLEDFHSFILEMRDLARNHNSKLYVIVHPIFYDFNNYDFTIIHKDLNQILENENIPYHDFLADFKNDDAEDLWITKNDQHPNEVAHEIYYKVLRKELDYILYGVN